MPILVVGMGQDDVGGGLDLVEGVLHGAGGTGELEHSQVVEAVAEDGKVGRVARQVLRDFEHGVRLVAQRVQDGQVVAAGIFFRGELELQCVAEQAHEVLGQRAQPLFFGHIDDLERLVQRLDTPMLLEPRIAAVVFKDVLLHRGLGRGIAERLVQLPVLEADDEGFDTVEPARRLDQLVPDRLADRLDVDDRLVGGDDHGAVEQDHRRGEMQRLEKKLRLGETARRGDGKRAVRRDAVPDVARKRADALVGAQKRMVEIGQVNGLLHKR